MLVEDGELFDRDPVCTSQTGTQTQTWEQVTHLLRQVWVSLVHLRVQGPNSMAQVHAGVKQHFDIEQIVHT